MGFHRAGWAVLMLAIAACGGATPTPEAPKTATADQAANAAKTTTNTTTNTSDPKTQPSAPTATAASPSGTAAQAKEGAASAVEPGAASTQADEAIALPDLAEAPGSSELESGAQAIQQEGWIVAQQRLGLALENLAKTNNNPDALLVGYALLGRSCSKGRSPRCAEKSYQKVINLWSDPATAQALKNRGSDAAARARHGRAALAAGEAMLFFAERMRADLERVRMPEYKGNTDRESISAFVRKDVAAFVQRKQSLIDEVDLAYGRIVEIQPAPPQLSVFAAARRAMMRGKLHAELRAAPLPRSWTRTGKDPATGLSYEVIRKHYFMAIDELGEPLRARARTSYQACSALAGHLSVENEYSRNCATWLEKNATR